MATYREIKGKKEKTVQAIIRVKGHPEYSKTFKAMYDENLNRMMSAKEAAKAWATAEEARLRRNDTLASIAPELLPPDGPEERPESYPLEKIVASYTSEHLPGLSAMQRTSVADRLNWWTARIGETPINKLTPAMINDAKVHLETKGSGYTFATKDPEDKRTRREKLSPSTVNKYLRALREVLNWAKRRYGLRGFENPFEMVKLPTPAPGIVRFLSDDERARLLDACRRSDNPILYTVVVLALATGMRRSEILTLKWADVDTQEGTLHLQQTKNNEKRMVPVADAEALDLLRRMKRERSTTSPLVFSAPLDPTKPYDFRSAWDVAVKKAALKDFRFHDLRHTTASYLAQNGCNQLDIANVLGHKSLAMTKRYSHLTIDRTREVLSNMLKKKNLG